ncbi:MAG: hypothetical protein JWP61_800 [Friedmanniella sp.]|nr:hypothetical protein [Friedmanniella sp.]
MLYLLIPPDTLMCCDTPRAREADPTSLRWTGSGRCATDDMIRVALRYGTPCSGGIMVDAIMVEDLDWATTLGRSIEQRNCDRALARSASDGRIEAAVPGWARRSDRADARIESAVSLVMDELDARAAQELRAPADPDLLEVWARSGGRVPPAI